MGQSIDQIDQFWKDQPKQSKATASGNVRYIKQGYVPVRKRDGYIDWNKAFSKNARNPYRFSNDSWEIKKFSGDRILDDNEGFQ